MNLFPNEVVGKPHSIIRDQYATNTVTGYKRPVDPGCQLAS